MTSCARWVGRVVSVYMPGRFLTGSSPLRTSIESALYCLGVLAGLAGAKTSDIDFRKRMVIRYWNGVWAIQECGTIATFTRKRQVVEKAARQWLTRLGLSSIPTSTSLRTLVLP